MPESLTLSMPVLGDRPYILIEVEPDPDSEAGFDLKVQAGGGISSQDDMTALLLMLVENLTGVSTDLYAQEVDIARRAAGLGPLGGAR